MALTVKDCENHLIHELGGLPSSDVKTYWLINQAGVHMVNMHPWRYLNRFTDGTTGNTIDFVSGTNYALLPDGFSEFIGLERANGLVNGFELTSFQDLIDMRVGTFPNTAFKTYGALYSASDANGLPELRLALHPTPTSSQTNAIVTAWRSTWVTATSRDDRSYLQMPDYMELLYVSLLRNIAAALELKRMTLQQALDEVAAGSLFALTVQHDAAKQRMAGPIRNGAMSTGGVMYSLYPSNLTANPS